MVMLLVYVDFFAMQACIGYLMIFANVLVFIFDVNWQITLLERFGAGLNEALPAMACIGYLMIFANVLVFIFEVDLQIMLLERFGAGLNEALPAKLTGKSCFLRGLALALMRRYLLRILSGVFFISLQIVILSQFCFISQMLYFSVVKNRRCLIRFASSLPIKINLLLRSFILNFSIRIFLFQNYLS
ncbi:uncharacterized protein [Primulina eburnea]|uniref:uncharacterized protein isoform X2 n=1 Tax=Primulina eburnea TaxID=1245227 RepID=UPI003C6BE8C1